MQKSTPRHELSSSSMEVCSLLCCTTAAGLVTWRVLGVEQTDAVQSVTRLLILRHGVPPSFYLFIAPVFCLLLMLNGATFAGGGTGYKKKVKKKRCFFFFLAGSTTENIWNTLKTMCSFWLFCFVDRWVIYAAGFQFNLKSWNQWLPDKIKMDWSE